jgi:hypothetical protein
MLGGIIEGHRPLEICLPVYDVARVKQGQAHDAMRHHEWPRRPLLVCESQELDSKLTHHVAVKRYKIRDPKAVKNEKSNTGSSGSSPIASAGSISSRARSTAALVSGAA